MHPSKHSVYTCSHFICSSAVYVYQYRKTHAVCMVFDATKICRSANNDKIYTVVQLSYKYDAGCL